MTIKDTDIITKTKLNLGNFNINLPNTFLPVPTDKDYKIGYIERYVVSKITGVLNSKYDGKMLLEQGVIDFNKKQVEQISTEIRGANSVFSNLMQFYKQTN